MTRSLRNPKASFTIEENTKLEIQNFLLNTDKNLSGLSEKIHRKLGEYIKAVFEKDMGELSFSLCKQCSDFIIKIYKNFKEKTKDTESRLEVFPITEG